MNNAHEFSKADLLVDNVWLNSEQPDSEQLDDQEEIDLDAEYTEEYHIGHAEELTEILLSMENEAIRRPEMDQDAFLKAEKIHEEIFHKGEKYQKIISKLKSILDGDGVTMKGVGQYKDEFSDETFQINQYLAMNLKLNNDSRKAVCQTISNGIFDILGLAENKRPTLRINETFDERELGDIEPRTLGYFKEPKDELGSSIEGNGTIVINLSNFYNFNGEPSIVSVLSALEHECFHAYQFNCRRIKMPIRIVRDRVMVSAYQYGHDQYITFDNDPEGYYEQGYEHSANFFAHLLTESIGNLFREAISQIIKGDING